MLDDPFDEEFRIAQQALHAEFVAQDLANQQGNLELLLEAQRESMGLGLY